MEVIYGQYSKELSLADLHIHTKYSKDGGKLEPHMVVDIASQWGLNAVAITDHDTLEGAKEAQSYALDIGSKVEVISGIEISTEEGHLIALYINDRIASGGSVENSIRTIHEQGGLVVIPHPNFRRIKSIKDGTIFHLAQQSQVDGFEVFNRGVKDIGSDSNEWALQFFMTHQGLGAAIGSSDTHGFTIGRGLTAYAGDLREAIEQKTTAVVFPDTQEQRFLIEVSIAIVGEEFMNHGGRLRNRLMRQFE